MARITVVNDSPEFLELVGEILEGDRYDTVLIDGDRNEAADEVVASRPGLLMIDLRLGAEGLHGWDIAQRLRAEPALERVPVLLCSADLVALRALENDLRPTRDVATLTKPFAIGDLLTAIDRLLAAAPSR